jgi:hypothetical protein
MNYQDLFYTLLGALVASNIIGRLIDRVEDAYYNYQDRKYINEFLEDRDLIERRLDALVGKVTKKKTK